MGESENFDAVKSLKKTARIVGILILVMSPFAVFGMMIVPSTLIVPGAAAATAGNIRAAEGLFRAGMVASSVVFLLEIAIVALLYVLLRPVNRTLSLIAAFFRLAMTVVQGVNLINHFAALHLLSGAGYLGAFPPAQLQALALLFLEVHESVALIWGLFFSLHLFLLGYLVMKSGYIPRILGVPLLITACCYLLIFLGSTLLPARAELYSALGLLSVVEVAFPVWLVIRGARERPAA